MQVDTTRLQTAWRHITQLVLRLRPRQEIPGASGLPGRAAVHCRALFRHLRSLASKTVGGANRALRGHLPAVLALGLGLLITGVAFFTTLGYYADQSQQEFDRPAARYTAVVSQSIDRYLEVVSSIGAFMAAAKEIDRWEFFALGEKSLPRFPGLQALEWVPRVTAKQRKRYEKRAEKDGLYGFRISERDTLGNRVAARPRDEYFPVYYVEPFENNQAILGFDLGSTSEGLKALQSARDSGQMIATRQVAWALGTDIQAAVLSILPIYRAETEPATLAERRDALAGFVLGVVRIGDMIEATLRDLSSTDALDIYIYDQAAPDGERLIYYHPSPLQRQLSEPLPESEVMSGLKRVTDYDVAGRQWTIVIKPVDEYFGGNINLVPWAVVAVGLLLTAMLLQYLMSSTNRTRIIEQSVAQRTAELLRANEALEREITERTRSENERMGLERELAQIQKMESLGVLAGGVAHEINTPVQYVGENLAFLKESFTELAQVFQRFRKVAETAEPTGEMKKLIDEANRAAETADLEFLREEIPTSIEHSLEGVARISEIVKAIREFSHPDAKEKSAVDINRQIETTITVARNQLKHVADVVTELDPALPQVPCMPGELNQVFLNLLVNAAHALEETGDGTMGRITVTTAALEDQVEIRIADTGPGIPENIRDKIFDPFFTTKEPGKGTGQGLAISHSIVTKKHGGSISVESEAGQGTTFIIKLPLKESGASQAAA